MPILLCPVLQVLHIETSMFESFMKRVEPKDSAALQQNQQNQQSAQDATPRTFRKRSRSRGQSLDKVRINGSCWNLCVPLLYGTYFGCQELPSPALSYKFYPAKPIIFTSGKRKLILSFYDYREKDASKICAYVKVPFYKNKSFVFSRM